MRLLSSLLLAGLSCAAFAADSITLTGEDDVKGGKRLGAWMAANDFEAETLESGSVRVKVKFLSPVLTPRLTKDSIDRLLVTCYFTTTDEAKADPAALTDMVMSLNAQSTIGCFSLDKDSDLMLQAQISFVDTIDKDEIEKYLSWFDTAAFVLLTKDKKAQPMLK